MKYQVFFLSLWCAFSIGAMHKSNEKTLENSAIVANRLVQYAHIVCPLNPSIDLENLAKHIVNVQRSPMTNRQRDKALALIYGQELALMDMIRRERQENNVAVYWRVNEPSEQRRKIN
jgi:hypothetical protein